ncbi:lysine-specific demethylase 5C [Dorcoceras hygrometricum]|uniref:Lysine-specific demethylase 5C n=1 Tax=Dorcoceras hygrometricum TaxID=472368 RepID=A0A2Z7CV82_9LAMI|nr:lysine-specific demethylase 5C [Dorcoceras hygrometricum]
MLTLPRRSLNTKTNAGEIWTIYTLGANTYALHQHDDVAEKSGQQALNAKRCLNQQISSHATRSLTLAQYSEIQTSRNDGVSAPTLQNTLRKNKGTSDQISQETRTSFAKTEQTSQNQISHSKSRKYQNFQNFSKREFRPENANEPSK